MKLADATKLHMTDFSQLIELHEMLFNISSDTEANIYEYILNSRFLQSKEDFHQLLDSINAALNSRPLKYNFYVSLVSFLSQHLKRYFSPEEIIDEIFGHNILRLQLIEDEIIDFPSIYEIDKSESTIIFFAPEIKKYYPEYFKENDFLVKNLDMNSHLSKRVEGMNESEVAILIRNDDIVGFQTYISSTNTSLNSCVPKSPYEICFFLKNRTTFLEYAAFFGSLQIFKFLWMNDVKVTEQIREFAVAGGNYEIIHIIETKRMKFDHECLDTSIQFHRNDIARYINEAFDIAYSIDSIAQCIMSYNIEMLLENFSVLEKDINLGNEWGWTALHFATMHGHLDLVKLLCEVENIDVNRKNNTGATPFHWSACYGHLDILKYLLENHYKQIDVNVKNIHGVTPLHLASYAGHLRVVKYLCELPEINASQKEDNGSIPFNYAGNNRIEVIKYLSTVKGIDINNQNFQGNAILHFAAKRGFLDVVKTLLELPGINVNPRNKSGKTPLYAALKRKRNNIVELLKAYGGTE